MLIACGYSCGASGTDGSFGNDTYGALVKFQKENGLEADGIYGSRSEAALKKKYTSLNKAAVTVEEAAKGVLAGKYGNGDARKKAIEALGLDYSIVQKRVNELVKGGSSGTSKKTVKEIAKEVIASKWGNRGTYFCSLWQ